MLAKICSEQKKPNGQFYLENSLEVIKDFMKKIPIRKVPGYFIYKIYYLYLFIYF